MYDKEHTEARIPRKPQNPFRTPDQYFESLDDRIMAGIRQAENPQSGKSKTVRFLKPVLGLVASFALVYLLVYYPINHFVPQNLVKTNQADSNSPGIPEAYSLSFASVDESTLFNVIISDDSKSETTLNTDDLVAYLASGSNDLDLYSEIQK
jgi:hypothetical protein